MISKELADGFAGAGYDPSYGKVTLSNRPDLCEYQCNGAMAGAKTYKKAPFMIAEDVAGRIKDRPCFEEVSVVKPGFINLKLNKEYIADYLNKMGEDPALGLDPVENPKMILVDYGGPNVAKPLHVGHLRSAIIGESIKRMGRGSIDLIIINTIIPTLFAYGRYLDDMRYQEQAVGLLEQLKAEENHIIRLWRQCGLEVQHAADSQALIQLKKEYCDRHECLRCRFGYEFLKSNKKQNNYGG